MTFLTRSHISDTGRDGYEEGEPRRLFRPRRDLFRRDFGSYLRGKSAAYPCPIRNCANSYFLERDLRRHVEEHSKNDDRSTTARKMLEPITTTMHSQQTSYRHVSSSNHSVEHAIPEYPLSTALSSAEKTRSCMLRDQVRHMIEKQDIDSAVEEVITLLASFGLTQSPVDVETTRMRLEELPGKHLLMNKYLADYQRVPASSDSGIGSSAFSSPYERAPEDFIARLVAGSRETPVRARGRIEIIQDQQQRMTRPVSPANSLLMNCAYPGYHSIQEVMNSPISAKDIDMTESEGGWKSEQCEGVKEHEASISDAEEIILQASDPSSSAEDTCSTSSDTTRAEDFATVVFGGRAVTITRPLLRFFSNVIDTRLGVHQLNRSTANEESNQSINGGRGAGSSQDTNVSTGGQNGRKRPISPYKSDNGANDPDEDDNGENQQKKRAKSDVTSGPKISCPYFKRYPIEFSTWRTCVGPGFEGVHRMKEHLKRKHFKENGCGRCGEHFSTNRLLQEHLRREERCEIRDRELALGYMTEIQWSDISTKTRKHGMSPSERWGAIYRILFPDVDEAHIPQPYFDATEARDNLNRIIDAPEYEEYLKKHLPNRIMGKLNEEFHIIAEQAKCRLVEIIQDESLDIFKNYLGERGAGGSILSPGTSSAPTDDTDCAESKFWDSINTSVFPLQPPLPIGSPSNQANCQNCGTPCTFSSTSLTWPWEKFGEIADSAIGVSDGIPES